MFTHLHVHSHYSILQAIGTPTDYIKKAKALGMSALALTDSDGMYGCIEHYKSCKKQGIKPLLGVELTLVQDYQQKTQLDHPQRIILLAKNYQGYQSLLQLTSHANLEWWQGQARIDRTLLQTHADHLIVIISGLQSLISYDITHQPALLDEHINKLMQIFGADHVLCSLLVGYPDKDPAITRYNQTILDISTRYGLPLICSPNVHMIDAEQRAAYEIFLCIKDNKRVYDTDKPKIDQPVWLMSEDEIKTTLTQQGYNHDLIDRMIQQTNTLANQIDITIPMETILFPSYQSSDEIQILYQQYVKTYT
jgi:DNA polymerase-3 subunit alpha